MLLQMCTDQSAKPAPKRGVHAVWHRILQVSAALLDKAAGLTNENSMRMEEKWHFSI